MSIETTPQPRTSDSLNALGTTIRHGFFTRQGGISEGIYQSLNAGPGSKDNSDFVETNRRLICEVLGSDQRQPATVSQCHSAEVVIAEHVWQQDRPQADAIVTREPGLAIGILTADCGPVLFADKDAGIVGAAHAGWKGAMGGILENTIEAMVDLGARRENITATLGPCISQQAYEVGPEYIATFQNADETNNRYFKPSNREGHHMFDLSTYIVDRLNDAGIQGDTMGLCTYSEPEYFFSYRRSVHLDEPDYGRQISAIMNNNKG